MCVSLRADQPDADVPGMQTGREAVTVVIFDTCYDLSVENAPRSHGSTTAAVAIVAPQWTNRITGHADVPPDQLLANPANFRRHPKPQQDALTGLIDGIGYLDPVIVQSGTDTVIDGHLRVELAIRSNQPTIPVTYVDLTDDEAALALATIDPVSAMAYHDAAQLDALLRDVSTDDAAVMALLSDLAESAGIMPADVFDANEHWQGMPEFENEDRKPKADLTIYFASEDEKIAFGESIGQKLTGKTKWVWHPARPNDAGVRWIE